MAIKVELINCSLEQGKVKAEASAAIELKQLFESEFSKYPQAKGTLYILRSVSIFGYPIRDIDLILIGYFNNFIVKGNYKPNNYSEISELHIDSFICNIELKDIDVIYDKHGNQLLKKIATAYVYHYKRSGKKDITEQAFEQMNSFRNFMHDTFNVKSPFMSDIIWFRSLDKSTLNDIRGKEKDNALCNGFAFKDLVNCLLLRQNVDIYSDKTIHLDSFKGQRSDIKILEKELCKPRVAKGLTRKKFEAISQAAKDITPIQNNVGSRLSIITGRAGTGKTIQLLQLAAYLSNDVNKKRVLLLTYNVALVSDIRRLLDFANLPISINDSSVEIKTVDSFFIHLMKTLEIIKDKELIPTNKDYNKDFENALKKFHGSILSELTSNDIEALKELAISPIDWDYILIDEGQDWPDLHKEVLFKLYGPKRIVVADGVDQFMMSSTKQMWNKGLKQGDVYLPKSMTVNLRQKSNLVEFVNAFSETLGLGWKSEKSKELLGGKIEIYNKYDSTIHDELVSHCKSSDCESYDLLWLVPPSFVTIESNGRTHLNDVKSTAYKAAHITFFDGTDNVNRHNRYPSTDQARLFQYDSCRGLEGWVTVCQELDTLIEYKINTINKAEFTKYYQGIDVNAGIKKYVYTWVLMPLTRPVDRLVITLKNPDSEIGKILKNLSEDFEFIDWNIK